MVFFRFIASPLTCNGRFENEFVGYTSLEGIKEDVKGENSPVFV